MTPALLPALLALSALCGRARADDDLVARAAAIMQARLPDARDPAGLDRAAVEGMARWLDQATGSPGNAVLTEAAFRARQDRLAGRRFGLGLEYTVAAGRGLLVTAVWPGTAAEAAGLAPGDLLVGVDDHPFTGLAGPAIAALVSDRTGPGAGPLQLDLRRGEAAPRRLRLAPAPFTAPPARLTRGDDHLRLQVDLVGPGVAEVLREALWQKPADAVVIDLRDVAEGELAAVRALAGLFAPPGAPLLLQRAADGDDLPITAEGDGAWKGRLVVLVNRGTAGPAEALAAGLRLRAGASLVGTRTAGIATLPSFYPLGEGLVLQLADLVLRDGAGASWAGEGLRPDLVVEPLVVPAVGPIRTLPPDIQLDAALRFVGAR